MEAGYICKKCGEPSPLGIGYASHDKGAHEHSKLLTQCKCGHSQKPDNAYTCRNCDTQFTKAPRQEAEYRCQGLTETPYDFMKRHPDEALCDDCHNVKMDWNSRCDDFEEERYYVY